jgi:hypothetical protein
MALTRASVGGPDFVKVRRQAEAVVLKLEKNNWDFGATPEVFAKQAHADVFAKEIAFVHDGSRQNIIGRLIMGGVGTHFNLMGPIRSDADFKVTQSALLDTINHQLGTSSLEDFPELRKLAPPQDVEFYNHTNFFSLRDLIFWHVLYGAGCFPSTLEHMTRHFAAGKVVQNNVYRPAIPSLSPKRPAIMQAKCMSLSFPSKVVEWMDKPLFGGLAPDTMHIEYLLTTTPSKVSHPYLPLEHEGIVEYGGTRWHIRRFKGITPKEGLRGPRVPPESAKRKQ